MVSPEYDAKLKEVTAEILVRVQAERAKAAMIQRPVEMLDTQIEAWFLEPKKQFMKELTQLSRSNDDPAVKRVDLEIIKAKAEATGAFEPQQRKGDKVIALRVNFINMGNNQPTINQIQNNNSVDIEARVIDSD